VEYDTLTYENVVEGDLYFAVNNTTGAVLQFVADADLTRPTLRR
jgi:hypothetical protein